MRTRPQQRVDGALSPAREQDWSAGLGPWAPYARNSGMARPVDMEDDEAHHHHLWRMQQQRLQQQEQQLHQQQRPEGGGFITSSTEEEEGDIVEQGMREADDKGDEEVEMSEASRWYRDEDPYDPPPPHSPDAQPRSQPEEAEEAAPQGPKRPRTARPRQGGDDHDHDMTTTQEEADKDSGDDDADMDMKKLAKKMMQTLRADLKDFKEVQQVQGGQISNLTKRLELESMERRQDMEVLRVDMQSLQLSKEPRPAPAPQEPRDS